MFDSTIKKNLLLEDLATYSSFSSIAMPNSYTYNIRIVK
jgi:hypothetical protein